MPSFEPIRTESAACQDCYKCVRECPVKAISVAGGKASIVPELCVLCGHCVEVCPAGAKKVRSDLERAKALIAMKPAVAASLAPSFAAEFPDLSPERLVAALRALGFALVSETAWGADSVSRSLAAELSGARDSGPGRVILSSACPVVNDYILLYRPELAGFLSPLASPLGAHAAELKASLGPGSAVVFIGPCIGKKREADRSGGAVDAAVTFRELRAWFEQAGVDPRRAVPSEQDAFYPRRAAKGSLYPVDGGMIAGIKKYAPGLSAQCVSYSGLGQIERALDGLESYDGLSPIFLELLACEGGCVNGPEAAHRSGSVRKRLAVLEYARSSADRRDAPAAPSVLRESAPVPRESSDDGAVVEALRSIGKNSPDDELNCSSCGYDSCRSFAAAMLSGKAERTMCVSYMRALAQKKANALIKAMPSGVVLVDTALKVVECNRAFARLLGPDAERLFDAKPGLEGADLRKLAPFWQVFEAAFAEGAFLSGGRDTLGRDVKFDGRVLSGSVFSVEPGLVVGGIFQDVTVPWIRKDRVVSQARAVIRRNVATVQKIAYLLGENAAESEAILQSIIESFSPRSAADDDPFGAIESDLGPRGPGGLG
ncbi:MAG: PAS domain-containing protein [Spirochaetes bacterium]|nr:PAS domain-containing protein [Spirochaetota bacterium]